MSGGKHTVDITEHVALKFCWLFILVTKCQMVSFLVGSAVYHCRMFEAVVTLRQDTQLCCVSLLRYVDLADMFFFPSNLQARSIEEYEVFIVVNEFATGFQ